MVLKILQNYINRFLHQAGVILQKIWSKGITIKKNKNDNSLAANHNEYYVTAGKVVLAALVPLKIKMQRAVGGRREAKGSLKNIFCGTESFSFFGTKNISLT